MQPGHLPAERLCRPSGGAGLAVQPARKSDPHGTSRPHHRAAGTSTLRKPTDGFTVRPAGFNAIRRWDGRWRDRKSAGWGRFLSRQPANPAKLCRWSLGPPPNPRRQSKDPLYIPTNPPDSRDPTSSAVFLKSLALGVRSPQPRLARVATAAPRARRSVLLSTCRTRGARTLQPEGVGSDATTSRWPVERQHLGPLEPFKQS